MSGPPRLRRLLGTGDSIGVLVAVTIGAGIYSTPQRIATHHHHLSTILWLWLLVGMMVLIGGMIWAELGSRLPVSGGNYVYMRKSYGPHISFLFGWKAFALTSPANRAALAIVAADYLGAFTPLDPHQRLWIAISLLVMLGLLNYVGVHWAVRFQNLTASLKVLGLVTLILVGLRAVFASPDLLRIAVVPTADMPAAGRVALSMMLIFFSYTGWARLGNVGEEVRSPRQTIPRSMFVGLPLIIGLYLLLNLVYHGVLGLEAVRESTTVVSDVATRLIGSSGALLASLLILLSVTGSMSVSILTHSRLLYAMARDGAFFRYLDSVHPVFHTPHRAIALHIAVAILWLLLKRNFTALVTSAIFLNILFYALRASTIFSLRRQRIGETGCYRMPFYPVLPVVFIMFLWGLFGVRLIFDWDRAWLDLLLLGLGIPASLAWHRLRKPA